jgi:hypothetical protein
MMGNPLVQLTDNEVRAPATQQASAGFHLIQLALCCMRIPNTLLLASHGVAHGNRSGSDILFPTGLGVDRMHL